MEIYLYFFPTDKLIVIYILVSKRNDTKIFFKYIFMLKPKQCFIIICVNVCVKRVYPHKANNNILFRNGKNSGKSIFRPMIEFAMVELSI